MEGEQSHHMSQRRVFRRFVLPTAWLLIGALIAISLVKLAFSGSSTTADDQLYPTGEIPAETIMVETATVENNLSIPGSIKLGTAQPLKAPVDGVLNWAFVKPGDNVSKGDRIFQIRTETTPEAPTFDPEAEADAEPAQPVAPVVAYRDVLAPATGTVSKFALQIDDDVTKGTELAAVQPPNFTAVGTINPLDRYRLSDSTNEATITIDGGPEPFTCTSLSIGDTSSQAPTTTPGSQDLETPDTEDASGSEISCAVPTDTVFFDGLSMRMDIDAGSAKNVLTVPVTAVRGLVGQGAVWQLNENGKEIRTEVELGVTDGKIIEVRSGLKAEAEVLRYVPGSTPAPEEEDFGMEIYP